MRAAWLLGVIACGSSGSTEAPATGSAAAPKPAATAPAGSGSGSAAPAAGPCLDEAALHVIAEPGGMRVCTEEPARCVAVYLPAGTMRVAPYVEPPGPAEVPRATVELHQGKLAACFDGRCKPLKRRLRAKVAAAIAARAKWEASDDNDDETWEPPAATTDLRAVTFMGELGDASLWSLDRDRPIATEGEYGVHEAWPIGTQLYVAANPPIAWALDSRGKQITMLDYEAIQFAMLDATRWLALTSFNHLYIVGAKTAREINVEGSDNNPGDVREGAFALLGDGTVGLATQRAERVYVVVVDLARATIVREWPIARCQRGA